MNAEEHLNQAEELLRQHRNDAEDRIALAGAALAHAAIALAKELQGVRRTVESINKKFRREG